MQYFSYFAAVKVKVISVHYILHATAEL